MSPAAPFRFVPPCPLESPKTNAVVFDDPYTQFPTLFTRIPLWFKAVFGCNTVLALETKFPNGAPVSTIPAVNKPAVNCLTFFIKLFFFISLLQLSIKENKITIQVVQSVCGICDFCSPSVMSVST